MSPSYRVAFIHPDLGIGGAERLVVDAAVGLQARGHSVVVYTSHHDSSHCFSETRDGTLDVRVRGDNIIPRSFSGKGHILCATLRSVQCAFALINEEPDVDIIIADQISANIPFLRQSKAKILFYCHYPDKLLTGRETLLKAIYRAPFDWLEEYTTGCADRVVVNSKFTASVFAQAFPNIHRAPGVIYPGIRFEAYDRPVDTSDLQVAYLESPKKTLLSINRFERKKNIALALSAFIRLREVDPEAARPYRLVLAGGYDTRVSENVEYHEELSRMAEDAGLTVDTLFPSTSPPPPANPSADVVFLLSFSDPQRTFLLATSSLLLYTPSGEHFGIVPVEAMYASLPVLAVNDGGPTESIVDGLTGWLRPPRVDDWVDAILGRITMPYGELEEMGLAGRARVQEEFSLDACIDRLDTTIHDLISLPPRPPSHSPLGSIIIAVLLLAVFLSLFLNILAF